MLAPTDGKSFVLVPAGEQCFALVPAGEQCFALAPTGGQSSCFSFNWWTKFVLAPTSGHPLALDLDCAGEVCENWLRMLYHFHELCCLIDKNIYLQAWL